MNLKFKYVSDGQVDKEATTIHGAMGVRKDIQLPYESLESMEQSLKSMNLIDMQSLAMELGVKPIADRNRLQRALADQYKRLQRTYGSAIKKDIPPFDPSEY